MATVGWWAGLGCPLGLVNRACHSCLPAVPGLVAHACHLPWNAWPQGSGLPAFFDLIHAFFFFFFFALKITPF